MNNSNMRHRSPSPPTTNSQEWQTVRGQNPDGSSTVYQVHESMMHGGGPPSGTGMHGAGMHHHHGSTHVSGGAGVPGGMAVGSGGSNMYGAPPPAPMASSYPPYTYSDYGQSPNIVYVQGEDDNHQTNDSDAESDDDEDPTSEYASNNTTSSDESESEPKPKITPLGIASGIILAISFIIGYCFFVEAIVNSSRVPKQSKSSSDSRLRTASAVGGGGGGVHPQSHQQYQYPPGTQNVPPQLTPQYYVLQSVNAEDVPADVMAVQQQQQQQQPRSIAGGGQPDSTAAAAAAAETRDASSASGLPAARHHSYSHGANGPVRRNK